MKKKTFVLLTGLVVTSSTAFAVPDSPEVDNESTAGGVYSATVNNAAVAMAIHPLRIVEGEQLTFPDLVVPSNASTAAPASVTVAGTATGVTTTYSSIATSPANSLTSGSNASGKGLVAKLGSVKIYGHENRAIAVTVKSSPNGPDISTDHYGFYIPPIQGEAGQYTLSNAVTGGDAATGYNYAEITFGGKFMATKDVPIGTYLYDSIDVTVHYRGGTN